LDRCGRVWIGFDKFGWVWMGLVRPLQVCIRLDRFAQVWIRLDGFVNDKVCDWFGFFAYLAWAMPNSVKNLIVEQLKYETTFKYV
jgi:hypothetical protein